MVKVATKHVTFTCGLRFLNAVFAVISFSAASNRSPTQADPTASETIGEGVASVERIIETTIASQDVETNPEVGHLHISRVFLVCQLCKRQLSRQIFNC